MNHSRGRCPLSVAYQSPGIFDCRVDISDIYHGYSFGGDGVHDRNAQTVRTRTGNETTHETRSPGLSDTPVRTEMYPINAHTIA